MGGKRNEKVFVHPKTRKIKIAPEKDERKSPANSKPVVFKLWL